MCRRSGFVRPFLNAALIRRGALYRLTRSDSGWGDNFDAFVLFQDFRHHCAVRFLSRAADGEHVGFQ
jgi:hypothetical protein